MERNRDGKRGCMAAVYGISSRRPRGGSSRDSPDEDGGMELQDAGRLRDRGSKNDQDRDRSGRSQRKIGDRLLHGSDKDKEEESSEDIMEEDEEEGDAETIQPPPPRRQSPPLTSSLSNNNHRKTDSAKVMRGPVVWKMADEMIGVAIPRKARSAYAKRALESGDPVHRQTSASPSSSEASVRKKMKQISGSKHRTPKISKRPSSIQEIEIEVAEVLYGLTRQFPVPLQQGDDEPYSNDANEPNMDAKSRVSSPGSFSPPPEVSPGSVLHVSGTSVASLSAAAPKRKKSRQVKVEDKKPADDASIEADHASSSVSSMCKKADGDQTKMQVQSPRSPKNVQPVQFEDASSLIQVESKYANASCASEAKRSPSRVERQKESNLLPKDTSFDELIANPSESDVKLTSAADTPREKFNIDSLGRKIDSFKTQEEKSGRTPTTTGETEKSAEEHDSRDPVNKKYPGAKVVKAWNIPKSGPTSEKTGGSLPLPMAAAGWPGGLPFGYMGQVPPFQPTGPADGPSSPNIPIRQPRLKRCAIHCYIAHNIFLHQQIAQMNPFWPMAAAKAYNPKGPTLNSTTEAAQRKQPVLRQPVQAGSTNNMLHAPAFFFPLGQPAKPSAAGSSSQGEAQYILLQNNSYPFRVGNHPQPMAFLNTPFYPSQMLHHPQLHQLGGAAPPPPPEMASEGSSSSNPKWQPIPLPQPLQNTKPKAIPPPMVYAVTNGGQGFMAARQLPLPEYGKKHEDDSKAVLPGKAAVSINGAKVGGGTTSAHHQQPVNRFPSNIPGFPQGLVQGGGAWKNTARAVAVPPSSPIPTMPKIMASPSQNHLIATPHHGQISFETSTAVVAAKNPPASFNAAKSSATVRPNGPSSSAMKSTAYPPSQLFFTGASLQLQNSAAAEYYMRQAAEQHQQAAKMPSQSSVMGALSLSPSSLSTAGRTASTSADASKINGVKGLASPSLLQAAQLSGAAFPYLSVPLLPVRPAEQKPTAGNDSLHPCWQQPEKR